MEETMRYYAACLILLSAVASAQEANPDRAAYCAGIAIFAERIMSDRQVGVPKEAHLANVHRYFNTQAEQLAAGALIEAAWDTKQASTPRRQQIQSNRFSATAEKDCLSGDIFPP